MKIAVLVFGFMAIACNAAADIGKQCVGIKESAKRLACFDAAWKAESAKPVPPSAPVAVKRLEGEVSQPLEIKGFTVGMESSQAKPKFDRCLTDTDCLHSPRGSVPSELDTVAGGRVDYFAAKFEAEKLVRLTIKMKTSSTLPVTSALSEKYGPPMREEEEFKTKGGLTTTKIKLTWRNGDSRMEVESPSGSIDTMMVRLYSLQHLEKSVQQSKEKAAKDL